MAGSVSAPISIPKVDTHPAAARMQQLCKEDEEQCWKRSDADRYQPVIDVDTMVARNKAQMWNRVLKMVPGIGPIVGYSMDGYEIGRTAGAVGGAIKGLFSIPFLLVGTVTGIMPAKAWGFAQRADEYTALQRTLTKAGVKEVAYPYWVEPHFFAKLDELEAKERNGDTSPVQLPDG